MPCELFAGMPLSDKRMPGKFLFGDPRDVLSGKRARGELLSCKLLSVMLPKRVIFCPVNL